MFFLYRRMSRAPFQPELPPYTAADCRQPIMKVAHWGYGYAAALFYKKEKDNLFLISI